MKTPTLEEVKEYFKDAEKINSAEPQHNGLVGKISRADKREIHFWGKEYWFCDKKKMNIMLWSPTYGYAKILSYKEPKEKTYKITREQILKYNMKDEFPEVFETKLTVGKWYKSLEHPKQIIFASDIKDVQHIKGYGFNTRGDWESCDDRFSWGLPTDGSYIEATEQEVTEALTKESVKRYKDGVVVECIKSKSHNWSNEEVYRTVKHNKTSWYPKSGDFWIEDLEGLYICVFDNGVWAATILTITKQQAEQKLKEIGVNAKIV